MLPSPKYDLRPAWEQAQVYLPGRATAIKPASLRDSEPVRAVIFMHGCGGISPDERSWAGFLSELGFMVVLPDSFAIKGRPMNCDPRSKLTSIGAIEPQELFALRLAEFRQALNELRKLPYVQEIYAMGFSEGGATVNMVARPDIAGIISIGSYCRGPVFVQTTIPVLTIDHAIDPYFVNSASPTNQCAEKYKSHSTHTQLVIPGPGHEAAANTEARAAVRALLKSR